MTQYDDIIVTPVYGPLSHQAPNAMGPHNLGVLRGTRATPQQFHPSQEPVYSEQFSNARQQYMRTAQTPQSILQARQLAIQRVNSAHLNTYSMSTQIHYPTSSHMNYIAPTDSSLYISRKKANAVGKSSYNIGYPAHTPVTTKNYFPTEVRTTLRRVRSGGCVAPKKKGAIANRHLSNPGALGIGSAVRSTY